MNLHDYIQETVHIKVEYVDLLPRKGPQLEAFLAIPDRAALEAAPHELVWEQTLSLPREWANNSPVLGAKNGQIKPDWKGLSPDEGGPLSAPAPVQYRVIDDPPDFLPEGQLVLEAVPLRLTSPGEPFDYLNREELRLQHELSGWSWTPEVVYRDLETWLEPELYFRAYIQGRSISIPWSASPAPHPTRCLSRPICLRQPCCASTKPAAGWIPQPK